MFSTSALCAWHCYGSYRQVGAESRESCHLLTLAGQGSCCFSCRVLRRQTAQRCSKMINLNTPVAQAADPLSPASILLQSKD